MVGFLDAKYNEATLCVSKRRIGFPKRCWKTAFTRFIFHFIALKVRETCSNSVFKRI